MNIFPIIRIELSAQFSHDLYSFSFGMF